jgi:hypothetical protein
VKSLRVYAADKGRKKKNEVSGPTITSITDTREFVEDPARTRNMRQPQACKCSAGVWLYVWLRPIHGDSQSLGGEWRLDSLFGA